MDHHVSHQICSKALIFDERCMGISKILYRTSRTISVPNEIANQPDFKGLKQFERHPELYYMVETDQNNQLVVNKTSFYCSICKSLKKVNGGDYMKHLRVHSNETQCSKKEVVDSMMMWALNITFHLMLYAINV